MNSIPQFRKDTIGVEFNGKRRTFGAYTFPTREGERTWIALDWYPWVKTCLALGVTLEGKIILIENYRFAIGRRVLELPGGDPQNADETLENVALREFREETGYEPGEPFQFLTAGWLQTGMSNAPFNVFFARNCTRTGKQNLDPVEEATGMIPVEMSIHELKDRIAYDPLSVDTHGIDRAILEIEKRDLIKPF